MSTYTYFTALPRSLDPSNSVDLLPHIWVQNQARVRPRCTSLSNMNIMYSFVSILSNINCEQFIFIVFELGEQKDARSGPKSDVLAGHPYALSQPVRLPRKSPSFMEPPARPSGETSHRYTSPPLRADTVVSCG